MKQIPVTPLRLPWMGLGGFATCGWSAALSCWADGRASATLACLAASLASSSLACLTPSLSALRCACRSAFFCRASNMRSRLCRQHTGLEHCSGISVSELRGQLLLWLLLWPISAQPQTRASASYAAQHVWHNVCEAALSLKKTKQLSCTSKPGDPASFVCESGGM